PQITDARHGRSLAQPHGALAGTGYHRAIVGDTEAGTHARLVIDVFGPARTDTDLLDDLAHEIGDQNRIGIAKVDARFLLHNVDTGRALQRVMGLDERANTVLELRDHLAAAI